MDEYVLDFVIPAGETGPNPPLCYIDYNTTTNAKRLSIKGTKIFHSNNDFTVNADNSLTIIPGTYEITFATIYTLAGINIFFLHYYMKF